MSDQYCAIKRTQKYVVATLVISFPLWALGMFRKGNKLEICVPGARFRHRLCLPLSAGVRNLGRGRPE